MRVTAVYNYHYHDRLLVHFEKHGTFRFASSSFSFAVFVSGSCVRVCNALYKPWHIFSPLHPISPNLASISHLCMYLFYTSTWIVYTRAHCTFLLSYIIDL